MHARLLPHWRRFRWRGAIFVAITALGFAGYAAGVGTTERATVADADVLTKLYYALGLFLFGGMDLGTPQGGPAWGRTALWVAYFAAPLVTASAVVEAVMRLVQPQAMRLRRHGGHVVVAGCGPLAQLYLERLRREEPGVPVLLVVDPAEAAAAEDLRVLYGVEVMQGEIRSPGFLRRLNLEASLRVLALTDDDFTNLDVAAGVMDLEPDAAARAVVHVSDLTFLRGLENTGLAKACQVFNGHEIAAKYLVRTGILDHFRRTEPADTVVLAGFGRFGQTVLAQLQSRAAGAFARVVIVDIEATRRAGVFGQQVGFAGDYEREVLDGDIRDPSIWTQVEAAVRAGAVEPVFVVGSGVDQANLRIAMALGQRYPDALILARSERRWAFAETLGTECGIQTVSVAQLVAQSMPAAWFSRALRSDDSGARVWATDAVLEAGRPARSASAPR